MDQAFSFFFFLGFRPISVAILASPERKKCGRKPYAMHDASAKAQDHDAEKYERMAMRMARNKLRPLPLLFKTGWRAVRCAIAAS